MPAVLLEFEALQTCSSTPVRYVSCSAIDVSTWLLWDSVPFSRDVGGGTVGFVTASGAADAAAGPRADSVSAAPGAASKLSGNTPTE
jgi:hypothetical protein